MPEEITVTVCCTTYNQEKFIRRCLEGLVAQECSFPFEVLVHDDASTDHTAQIVQEFAERYPKIIVPILQKENQYSKQVNIVLTHILPKARGTYFAFCEGDDYWTDPQKLEKQVKAMQANRTCRLCLHRVIGVWEDETPINREYPYFPLKTGSFSGEKLLDYICTNKYVFQTTSFFIYTNDLRKLAALDPSYMKVAATFDTPLLLHCATLGDAYYIDETMSCYRHMNIENSPRRLQYENTEEKRVAHYNKQIRMMEEFDKFTQGKHHKLCERKINGYHFDRAIRNQDFKELCKPKYSYFKRDWTLKAKVKVMLQAYCPWLFSEKQHTENR